MGIRYRNQGMILFLCGAFGGLFDFIELKTLLSDMGLAASTEKALA
jgi:hypothetical protein